MTNAVSMESFVHEIRMDLPRLYQAHPEGISIHVLHEEYGEPIPRILRAIQLLESKHVVKVRQGASKQHYVLPFDVVEDDIQATPYRELTQLQRNLFKILVESQHAESHLVRTNYTQLARILQCSHGGVTSSISRLVTLEYLKVHEPPIPGKQNSLVLWVNPDKVQLPANRDLPP